MSGTKKSWDYEENGYLVEQERNGKEGIMSTKSWDYEWVENGYLVQRGVTEDADALIVQIEAAEEETARSELEFANACIELDGDEPLESMTMSGRISFWPVDDPEGMASDWAWTHDFECVATLEEDDDEESEGDKS